MPGGVVASSATALSRTGGTVTSDESSRAAAAGVPRGRGGAGVVGTAVPRPVPTTIIGGGGNFVYVSHPFYGPWGWYCPWFGGGFGWYSGYIGYNPYWYSGTYWGWGRYGYWYDPLYYGGG